MLEGRVTVTAHLPEGEASLPGSACRSGSLAVASTSGLWIPHLRGGPPHPSSCSGCGLETIPTCSEAMPGPSGFPVGPAFYTAVYGDSSPPRARLTSPWLTTYSLLTQLQSPPALLPCLQSMGHFKEQKPVCGILPLKALRHLSFSFLWWCWGLNPEPHTC